MTDIVYTLALAAVRIANAPADFVPPDAVMAEPAGLRLSGAASAESIAVTKRSAAQKGWTDIVVTQASRSRSCPAIGGSRRW